MCGITGFLHASGAVDAAEADTELLRMERAMPHRGPDDEGTWCQPDGGIGLGHRRLSIVDLSPLGHQPMHSPSRRFSIAFNGEIYNYLALRADLLARGFSFRSTSDTEVLLAGFEAWGLVETLQRCSGMFAIALWDAQERQLHLARDRFGEKPLYYGQCGELLLFGSELKSLRAHSGWRGDIDRTALALLLANSYIPAPLSIYRQVRKLLPGEVASVRAVAGRFDISLQRYWDPAATVQRCLATTIDTPEAAVDGVEAALRRAVSRQMVADVPVGAFLSGGVDSSLVVGVMQSLSRQPVRSFSIGFWEQEYNEAPFAKAVAAHLGTQHTELVVTPDDALAVIPDLPQIYDEPFADSSQIPTYLLARLTRQSVTVSLSGDGGDELFNGYERYAQGDQLWQGMQRVPRGLRALAGGAVNAMSPGLLDALTGPLRLSSRFRARHDMSDRLLERACVWPAGDMQDAYQLMIAKWKNGAQVAIGADPAALARAQHIELPQGLNAQQTMQYIDMCRYMTDDVLVKVDRAAMRASLETRVPLLDPEVATMAWRIPTAMHRRDQRGQWVLRQLLDRYVPRALIERPKRGFAIPVAQWLRTELRPWAEELLDESRLRREGYFDPEPITRRWRQHLAGGTDWSFHLWIVLSFQAWLAAGGDR